MVEHLDVLEYFSLGLRSALVSPLAHQFGLEGLKPTLHGRVVPAVTLLGSLFTFGSNKAIMKQLLSQRSFRLLGPPACHIDWQQDPGS
jgi:hypothetical protein